ncbi:MAG: SRPBCC domain-containing protein [Planctomycetaceae bacterium]|nr:SRPBCC domain-containing protein [Planctomycetaceae bacterium]
MTPNSIPVMLAAVLCCVPAYGQDDRLVDEFEIEAGIDDVWNAFTTTEGLRSWVAPLVDVDFRVGGKWRANYNKDGQLGDDTTIENTILSYDPLHMISLKATRFPSGFEFADAAKDTWSVFYFTRVTEKTTKITIVGLGYNDTEQSRKMRAFFKPANQYSMDRLRAALEKPAQQEEK